MKENLLMTAISSALVFFVAVAPSYASPMDQMKPFTDLFLALDSDRSGVLDQQEAIDSGLGLDSFKKLDSDRNKVVSLTEFLVLAEQTESSLVPSEPPHSL